MNQLITIDDVDGETVLRYFSSEKRRSGYTGLCAINISILAKIHLEKSIQIASEAIKKAQQSK